MIHRKTPFKGMTVDVIKKQILGHAVKFDFGAMFATD
jgi:hypothetical protein